MLGTTVSFEQSKRDNKPVAYRSHIALRLEKSRLNRKIRLNKMSQEDFQKCIDEVMLKVIENLGPDIDEARYELCGSPTDIFMSTLYNVSVKFKNKTNGKREELAMILKKPIQLEAINQIYRIDSQFNNEILFYRLYSRPDENFARCFYIDEKPPYDSVIILENVNKRGYQSCPRSSYAPLEYTLAAMREMGRFHGKGYVMKERQRGKFFDIVGQIQESRFNEFASEYKLLINLTASRAVEYLRNRGYDAVFCDKTERLLSNAFDEIMMKIIEPLEPLSTLCHGDFTLDNTLFKAEDGGRYRAMLIDFALLTYGTPVIDLSTYLCLSCSNELMGEKFSEIMQAYHGALKEYLLEAGIWDAEKYSYDALLDDYKRGALFGFVIASFYLSTLLGYFNKGPLGIIDIGMAAAAKLCRESGGDEMSKILADMLLHLRDLGCLQLL